LTDALDDTFKALREALADSQRLTPTHADPFFNFVHAPRETRALHQRLPRWRSVLERDGWRVEVRSLAPLLWSVVDASGRWDDWMETETTGEYREANQSMRDVLNEDKKQPRTRPGLARTLAPWLTDETPRRLLLLTDAALLHPWFRVRTLETWFHDAIRCPTVLFYPGRRSGQFGLLCLSVYPEDGNYRSTIVGRL
jgi:hypothetical protein